MKVVNETSPNLQGSCRDTSRLCMQNYMKNGWELTSELTYLFEVLNQSLPNLQGSCRSSSRWCLQNYMENGWELTSELTSKWITFKNTQSNFTLFSLITFEVSNETPPHLQGSCRNTSRLCLQNYMENGWELTSELTYLFEVLNQSLPNLQGSCRSSSRWCLQNYMENGWELTSELTFKWITFKNTQSNFTLISLITFEVINETSPNLQGSCRNTSRWCLQNYMGNG